ncbi:pyrroline-5-carboxylate reductase [Arthrobacter sp. zg-Y20]|uniref:pyrroline-5-carboxylate reductase n=1 Tax=unclassified Arthrobacter TaxID=235627 RepID=UPI001D1384A6|nr:MULTISPECIES: pyrroline-5-carboxylate reductase [unclassified Arthrobacter]MCC3275885.1 pyrroline-5-carboxylate reductase [Arthrobacter sp. zg-Y20]MDK1316042.1 pyrroline-5-carboxylate reductase [Arthrobacter sp. zg.Y20]WIB05665.1 pyrroline-5-carboxylate reductase [Arthrobacter sp. zg-Y20]
MDSASNPRLAFLGCGSMNEAILGGILAGGLPAEQVTATVRRPERAEELRAAHGITVLAGGEDAESNRKAVAGADLVIVGVKPVGVADLLREVADALPRGAVVLSVAAAVPLELMESLLPAGQPVVRAMPNTPSRLGRGVVSISAGTSAGSEAMELARRVLAATGTVVEVPEEQVDAVSAISGSGPAYAFYLAEAMARAGVELGLDPDLSALLARETVAGAGYMLAEPDADATALRRGVTSPNGTTEAAIKTFDERGLPAIIEAGARAATARAEEITKQLTA